MVAFKKGLNMTGHDLTNCGRVDGVTTVMNATVSYFAQDSLGITTTVIIIDDAATPITHIMTHRLGIITAYSTGPMEHCPRLDAWIGNKWVAVGRPIYNCINTSNKRRHDIVLKISAQKFRIVEDEPNEYSTITAIRGDGEDWGLSPAKTKPGSEIHFSFSKQVKVIETEGWYRHG